MQAGLDAVQLLLSSIVCDCAFLHLTPRQLHSRFSFLKSFFSNHELQKPFPVLLLGPGGRVRPRTRRRGQASGPEDYQ